MEPTLTKLNLTENTMKHCEPTNTYHPSSMDALLSGQQLCDLQSSTFEFPEIELGSLTTRPEGSEWKNDTNECYRLSSQIRSNEKVMKSGDTLHFSSDHPDSIRASFGHGLLGTIYQAYSKHIPLILRPDDIWISICVAFGNYVNKHAQEMRSCFVDHGGRKQLEIKVWSPFMEFTTENHWYGFLKQMEKKIAENVKGDVTEWMIPNFTTTTFRDRAVGTAVLMGALKEYFSYKCYMCCGLSKVTLMGSLDDWANLVQKAKYLYTFNQQNLTAWADLLVPVLEKFVDAYKGNIERDFWQRICTYRSIGSGGDKEFRGWFLVFSPFDESGHYLLRSKEQVNQDHIYADVLDSTIVDCLIECPFIVEDHTKECGDAFTRPGGKKYEITPVKNEQGLLASAKNEQLQITPEE